MLQEENKRVWKPCWSCDGSGKQCCLGCHGLGGHQATWMEFGFCMSGKVLCWRCHGTGMENCDRCFGTGKLLQF